MQQGYCSQSYQQNVGRTVEIVCRQTALFLSMITNSFKNNDLVCYPGPCSHFFPQNLCKTGGISRA